jgi:hypothetical protein
MHCNSGYTVYFFYNQQFLTRLYKNVHYMLLLMVSVDYLRVDHLWVDEGFCNPFLV